MRNALLSLSLVSLTVAPAAALGRVRFDHDGPCKGTYDESKHEKRVVEDTAEFVTAMAAWMPRSVFSYHDCVIVGSGAPCRSRTMPGFSRKMTESADGMEAELAAHVKRVNALTLPKEFEPRRKKLVDEHRILSFIEVSKARFEAGDEKALEAKFEGKGLENCGKHAAAIPAAREADAARAELCAAGKGTDCRKRPEGRFLQSAYSRAVGDWHSCALSELRSRFGSYESDRGWKDFEKMLVEHHCEGYDEDRD